MADEQTEEEYDDQGEEEDRSDQGEGAAAEGDEYTEDYEEEGDYDEEETAQEEESPEPAKSAKEKVGSAAEGHFTGRRLIPTWEEVDFDDFDHDSLSNSLSPVDRTELSTLRL